MPLAPIILFVYNRPTHTRRLLESLYANKEAAGSSLFIFADGPKTGATSEQISNILVTRNIIREKRWCGEVHIQEREQNAGLAKSVIEGITQIVNEFEKVIVLEDDLLLSPYFLQYMNEGLELYEKEDSVISIHGYLYPVKEVLPETFFIRGADCWGWGTWKRGWGLMETDGRTLLNKLHLKGLTRQFNFNNSYNYTRMLRKQVDGRNSSWDILWYATAFLKNKLTLYPGRSLVRNTGNDGSGTHAKITDNFSVILTNRPLHISKITIAHHQGAAKYFGLYFRSIQPIIFVRVVQKLKSGLQILIAADQRRKILNQPGIKREIGMQDSEEMAPAFPS